MVGKETVMAYDVMHSTGFRLGSVRFFSFRNGWKFVPNVPHRRGSRKFYATPEAAIPAWCKGATMVARD